MRRARRVTGLPGLDPMLAEPAGQGLGRDGPCGRAAGEEREYRTSTQEPDGLDRALR